MELPAKQMEAQTAPFEGAEVAEVIAEVAKDGDKIETVQTLKKKAVEIAEPVKGKMVPLRTFMEHKASVELIEVYSVPVPTRKANSVISALEGVLPQTSRSTFDMQHLRRLVREEFLPRAVLEKMRRTAIENAVVAKALPEFAVVEVEGNGGPPTGLILRMEDRERTSSSASSGSNASTSTTETQSLQKSRKPRGRQPQQVQAEKAEAKSTNKPAGASNDVSVTLSNKPVGPSDDIPVTKSQSSNKPTGASDDKKALEELKIENGDELGQEEQAAQAPKKKAKRRSSAEKRAAKKERDRIALLKLKIADGLADPNECAVLSPPSTPTSPVHSSPSPIEGPPMEPTSPVEGQDENTPPTGPTKRRRRSRRSRSGSTGTEGSTTPKKPQKVTLLHMLLAAKSQVDLVSLYEILIPLLYPNFPEISTVEVPLHASTSQDQADHWSIHYWPSIYKRGNPFGPHPPHVDATILRTIPKVPEYMGIAREAARQVLESGKGLTIGAVVVDPTNAEVIAAAGDGRHMTFGPGDGKGSAWGNPLEHAVLRVVGMVAEKRKLREKFEIGTKVHGAEAIRLMKESEDSIRHRPVTDIEKQYFHTIPTKRVASKNDVLDSSIMNTEAEAAEHAQTEAAEHAQTEAAEHAQTEASEHAQTEAEGRHEIGVESDRRVRDAGEYLCHNHIVYLTHEPCVMCSMALIHSRVGIVIIDAKNKAARAGCGGLYVGGSPFYEPSEEHQRHALKIKRKSKEDYSRSKGLERVETDERKSSEGYGLFWRKELNWKFLAFEWDEGPSNSGVQIEGHDLLA